MTRTLVVRDGASSSLAARALVGALSRLSVPGLRIVLPGAEQVDQAASSPGDVYLDASGSAAADARLSNPDVAIYFSEAARARAQHPEPDRDHSGTSELVIGVGSEPPVVTDPENLVVFFCDPAGRRRMVAEDAMRRIGRVRPEVRLVMADPTDPQVAELHDRAAISVHLDEDGDATPLVESLRRGLVTVAAKGAQWYETGGGLVDWVHYGTAGEVAETVLAYLRSPELWRARRDQIRDGFALPAWDAIASGLASMVMNLDHADSIADLPIPETMQWVFISNRPDSLRSTIAAIDSTVDWVREYVVVTPAAHTEEIAAFEAAHPIVVVVEEQLVDVSSARFRAANHVLRNWMIRSALTRLELIDSEFIMLDDDNRPLAPVGRDLFFGDRQRYNGYYFYDLGRWPHRSTDYDLGMQCTRELLQSAALERLAYSSHQPQVINKSLFAEAIALAEGQPGSGPVEEWSVYFNYLASRYPTLLSRRVYRTLHWPASAATWQRGFVPPGYSFENHYPDSYAAGSYDADSYTAGSSQELHPGMSAGEKLHLDAQERRPYEQSTEIFESSRDILVRADLVHGAMVFKSDAATLVVRGVPHLVTVIAGGPLRLPLSFALLGAHGTSTEPAMEAQFCYRVLRTSYSFGAAVEGRASEVEWIPHGLIELDIPAQPLSPGVYELEFFAKFDGVPVFVNDVVFRSRLVVCGPDETIPGAYRNL